MSNEEIIAKTVYTDVPLEQALKFIEKDKETGKYLYNANEILRCMYELQKQISYAR